MNDKQQNEAESITSNTRICSSKKFSFLIHILSFIYSIYAVLLHRLRQCKG